MKATRSVSATGVVLSLLLCTTAVAQNLDIRTVSGGSSDPDSGTDITNAIGNSWNVPPYDCTTALAGEQTTSTFVVTKLTGPCLNKTYSTDFTVGEQINGDFGLTMQVACDGGSGELTSWVGACDGNDVKCACVGAPVPLGECPPGTPQGFPGSCKGSCTLSGTCSGTTCTGDAGRNCITDADCNYCNNNQDVLCSTDANCDFTDPQCPGTDAECAVDACGPLRGVCSGNDAIVCNPPSVPGPLLCSGTCTPDGCGTDVAGFCDDNPNRSCTTAAQCGKCSNAPLEPCEFNSDCDFGTCEEGLVNTDDGQTTDFFGIKVRESPPPPVDGGTQLPLLDPLRVTLLIVGLLTLGVALLLRRARVR